MARIIRDDIDRFMQLDLDVASRTVWLGGAVDDDMLELVAKCVHLFNRSRKDEAINIYLSSGGGDVTAGLGIYDLLVGSDAPVHITVVGEASSMAAVILQAATKRLMTANSHLMVHQGTIEPPEDHAKNIKAYMKNADKQDETCDRILLARIQEKYPDYRWNRLRKATEFDSYLTAVQALNLNLIDEVIE